MMDENDSLGLIIKEEIQKKFGQEISYAKDCQILSDTILEKTNRQISVSTLKRFFGIIQTKFNPSKYTLDTLAIYLKFKNWNDFLDNFENNRPTPSEGDEWIQVKNRAQVITNTSLKSLKAKIGDQLSDFPIRTFAVEKFDSFLNSPQFATAFIAPAGYGKSTIVSQLTEMYFTGADAKCPNDIVCLIDGSMLVNLASQNVEILRIQNILNFEQDKSFSNYFRENPNKVGGRFILIINGLSEIYYQAEKLNLFVENLMDVISSYEDISWAKLLITCSPDNWKMFSNIIHKRPELKSKWFDVSFEGTMTDSINVPLLDKDEIKYFLEKKDSSLNFENLNFHYPEITEIINNPYFLHLFNLSQNPENVHTDIELLNQFVHKKVLLEPYLEGKSAIINSYFQISECAKHGTSVKKEDLPKLDEYNRAYKELISDCILHEYSVPGSYLSVNTYVKFSHDILLEFFLANKWIKENKFDLNLLQRIIKFYENNPQLQQNILKYLIKYAFKEGNTDLLKDIYSIFESDKRSLGPSRIIQNNPEIINVVAVELRNNKKIRDFLIPLYAKSELGQLFYFERFFDFDSLVLHSGDDIDYYLENKHTADAMIYGHFLKFMQYFLAGDQPNCKKEYEVIQSFELPDNLKPLHAAYYYGPQVIYQSVYDNKLDKDLVGEIYQMSDLLYQTGAQSKVSIPDFEFLIIFCLNFGDRFAEIRELINLIFDRYDFSDFSNSWLYQLFFSIHARTLLNTGDVQKGFEFFNQVEFKTIPKSHKYFMKLRYSLIKLEFLIFENKFDEAKQIIAEIKTISHMIRHKFYYDKALMFEKKIYPEIF